MNYYSIAQILFTCVRVLDALKSKVGGEAIPLKSGQGAEPLGKQSRELESDKPKISRVSKWGFWTGNVTSKIWRSVTWVQDEPSVKDGAIFWYRLSYLQLAMCWPHWNKDLRYYGHILYGCFHFDVFHLTIKPIFQMGLINHFSGIVGL